jgi:hypothetical protein
MRDAVDRDGLSPILVKTVLTGSMNVSRSDVLFALTVPCKTVWLLIMVGLPSLSRCVTILVNPSAWMETGKAHVRLKPGWSRSITTSFVVTIVDGAARAVATLASAATRTIPRPISGKRGNRSAFIVVLLWG